jgi:phosphate transport system permease protein
MSSRAVIGKGMGKGKPIGERWVWLTSMGLALGVMMVVTLLGLILVNGLGVFWPKPVVRLELAADSGAAMRGTNVLGGMIAGERVKTLQPGEVVDEAAPEREWHLFLGNKDVYGASFRYVDQADALAVTYPAEAMLIERMEYGHAVGEPLALVLADGTVVSADAPDFVARLQARLDEVNRRRAVIRKIERVTIGTINHTMERLRMERKRLVAGDAGAEELAALDARYADLQEAYGVHAEEAARLRALQEGDTFRYRLFTGETHQFSVGEMVYFHFPNRMTWLEKLGHFGHGLWSFVSQEPREANTEGGIFPAIFGTFVMTLLMSIAVMPFGVLAAIYLREYARQGAFVRMVRISVNNLAGVPSIVFGVFGLGFFVYFVGGSLDQLFFSDRLPTPTYGTGGILWASLTLALMTVPVVIVATEEALAAVPRGVREGSLALGASKWQTIARCVLPASAPGILTGLVLAMARGAGEVAPLMLVGVVKLAPSLPIDHLYPFIHLDQKFMHLGFHIYDLGFQSPDSDAAKPMVFATTLFLILLVVLLNLGAIIVRERLRKRYATGAF